MESGMDLRTTVIGLYSFTRAEIMVAFVVPVTLLGIACAMNTGLPIDWNNLILGGCVIFFLLMISNGLNSVVDEKIDAAALEAGSEKSRMYHSFNIWGGLSRGVIFCVVALSVLAVMLLLGTLVMCTGYTVVAFVSFGMFMAVEYNFPPLKLAYRPFPELTMLLPSTIVAVIAMQYILVSYVTALAVYMGVAFGLFSATWFVWQSMVDYEVDMEAGKKTTPVYMGPLSAGIFGIVYSGLGLVPLILGAGQGLPLYTPMMLGFICLVAMGAIMIFGLMDSVKVWKRTMLAVFLFGVASALAIMLGGK
jgi:1,4-dihydroxy-2-naphthoate octaprenyltransferase